MCRQCPQGWLGRWPHEAFDEPETFPAATTPEESEAALLEASCPHRSTISPSRLLTAVAVVSPDDHLASLQRRPEVATETTSSSVCQFPPRRRAPLHKPGPPTTPIGLAAMYVSVMTCSLADWDRIHIPRQRQTRGLSPLPSPAFLRPCLNGGGKGE